MRIVYPDRSRAALCAWLNAPMLTISILQIRSVYRTIEGLQGYDGALATNEHTFYLFDSLPLLIAIGVYALFWPGSYIDSDRLAAGSAGYSHELLAKPAGVESTDQVDASRQA